MADLNVHWRGVTRVEIRAISIDGTNWVSIETDLDRLVIFTATPEQAGDIAEGFRKAFGLNEDKT